MEDQQRENWASEPTRLRQPGEIKSYLISICARNISHANGFLSLAQSKIDLLCIPSEEHMALREAQYEYWPSGNAAFRRLSFISGGVSS